MPTSSQSSGKPQPEAKPTKDKVKKQKSALTAAQRKKDIQENKDLAALSYVWVMALYMLLFKRQSPFIRFHARQGTILFLISMVGLNLPVFSQFLQIVVFVGCAWGFILAAQGREDEVPFIGPLSRGQLGWRESWKKFVTGVAEGVKHAKAMWQDTEPRHPHGHESS